MPEAEETMPCASCGAIVGRNWFMTCDGRTWCHEHGPMAIRLELEAYNRGEQSFTVPGPVLLWARDQVRKNNRRRFGP
jgi:hypothetical protein